MTNTTTDTARAGGSSASASTSEVMGRLEVSMDGNGPVQMSFTSTSGVYDLREIRALMSPFPALDNLVGEAITRVVQASPVTSVKFSFNIMKPTEDEAASAPVDPAAHQDDQADSPRQEESNDVR